MAHPEVPTPEVLPIYHLPLLMVWVLVKSAGGIGNIA